MASGFLCSFVEAAGVAVSLGRGCIVRYIYTCLFSSRPPLARRLFSFSFSRTLALFQFSRERALNLWRLLCIVTEYRIKALQLPNTDQVKYTSSSFSLNSLPILYIHFRFSTTASPLQFTAARFSSRFNTYSSTLLSLSPFISLCFR